MPVALSITNDLEVVEASEPVYNTPLNNIMGAKTILDIIIEESIVQQSPQL